MEKPEEEAMSKEKEQKPWGDYFVKAGSRGGLARSKALSKERKAEIGRLGAKARWDRYKKAREAEEKE